MVHGISRHFPIIIFIMKRISLIFIICILTVISSCGNSNGKKNASAIVTEQTKVEILDPYTFILMYYDTDRTETTKNSTLTNSYGYEHVGDIEKSTGFIDNIYVRGCNYNSETRQYTGLSEKSAGIKITTNPQSGTRSLWQFVYSVSERDQIFEKLKSMGFQFESFGDNRYHLQNEFIGIDCQLESEVWVYRTTVYGSCDYPFIKPINVFSFENETRNAQKFLNDYQDKRIKITGKVVRIEQYSSKYSLYQFSGDWFSFDVFIPNEQAFYNINLPAKMTISGYLTDASLRSLTLRNVYFYDNAGKQYVGPNRPTYKTETAFSRPKIYERQTSSAEVTNKPIFKNKGHNSLTLEQVKVTDQETILSFYTDARIPGTDSYHEWCSIDPNAYIVANGKKYKLTNAEGIAKSPETTKYPIMTMSLNFSLHFPAIPSNTTIIDFYENGESDWFIEGIQLNAPNTQIVPDYVFSGYLTDGRQKYNIEMKLYFVDSYHFEGYYRYLSQSADSKIGVQGELASGTGIFANSEYFSVFTDDGTERFDFDINENVASGKWFKYDSAYDCEMGHSNYRKSLTLQMTKK